MKDLIEWSGYQQIQNKRFTCGYCGADIATDRGWNGKHKGAKPGAFLMICPNCTYPTFLPNDEPQVPGVRFGNDVEGVDDESVLTLYNEARDCTATNAHTAAVLCCRKILMHLAVDKGAKSGQTFVSYVDFLANEGYVPPGGREWVDHIRQMGNQANHEISLYEPEKFQRTAFICRNAVEIYL